MMSLGDLKADVAKLSPGLVLSEIGDVHAFLRRLEDEATWHVLRAWDIGVVGVGPETFRGLLVYMGQSIRFPPEPGSHAVEFWLACGAVRLRPDMSVPEWAFQPSPEAVWRKANA